MLYVLTNWQREIVGRTLLTIFQNTGLLSHLGVYPILRRKRDADNYTCVDNDSLQGRGEKTSASFLLNELMHMGLHTCFQLDSYAVQPSSFPWRFFVLAVTGDEQEVNATLDAAKEEWNIVLAFEKDMPEFLSKRYPVSTWFAYREVMTVRTSMTNRNLYSRLGTRILITIC